MDELAIKALRFTHRLAIAIKRLWHRGGSLLPPISKSVVFGLLLWYAQGSGFEFWPIILFVGAALIFYMQPVYKAFTLKTALIVILFISLFLTSRFTITLPVELHASALGQLLFAAAFGFLYFMLLGIKNVILVRRRQWYTALFISLVYGISLLFFTSVGSESYLRYTLLLAVFIYLLLREYFTVQEYPQHRSLKVIALTGTLLMIESAWVLSLLPLGFSKAASILTLLAMMLSGIIDHYIRGTLTARFLRLSLFLFVILTSVVFASVRWVI